MKFILLIACLFFCMVGHMQMAMPLLKISDNKRYFQTADGKPFFWLGDTGWLLFTKCSREEALHYLDKRQQQGFNVVQIMLLHTLKATDVYGDSALVNGNIAQPDLANGYWKHVDFILHEAAKRGIYMALVPVWGGNVKEGKITAQQATLYAAFLARRFKNENNIVWLNGGDIKGSDGLQVWKAIGTTIKKYDPRHLQTFHPRGRTSSSEWFHKEAWLDFNMFQSGHKDYAQDTSSNEQHHYGEDNWKFVQADYKLLPVKPSMDGEPSYENIPHGLHDSLAERWTAADLRRYAYWSVLAGGAGFTYGENAVMQFNTRGDRTANFGVSNNWNNTIDAPGAGEMKYLKQLMLAVSYFDRVPAQEIIVDNTRDRYHYLLASKGQKYVMVYVYTGRNFSLDLSALHFKAKKAGWFNPKNGTTTAIDDFKAAGVLAFDPPGEEAEGNDWVLLIE